MKTLVSFFFLLILSNPLSVKNNLHLQKNKYIYFSSNLNSRGRDIVRISADGSGPRVKLTSNNGRGHYPHHNGPKLSPDGTKIAYHSDTDGHDNYSIWVMNIDGSNKRRLTKEEGLYSNWSADGKSIIFSGRRNGTWEILMVPAIGGKEINLTQNYKKKKRPSWGATSTSHPDGKSIIYSYIREKVLYSMNLQTKEIKQISPNGESYTNPSFSKDGKRIAVNRKIDKSYDMITMSPNGNSISLIVKNVISYSAPSWSDSGREILFVGSAKGNQELFKISLDTKKEIQLTNNSNFDAFPTW
ncbi:TolB family protein [Pontimicrobium aquaticum]|uniref:Peptidase S9A N-terminal domain-containing protein n=1 Tax=Pontimicrobium aquaticum TaxID=2565367 RepID=A0A4U0F0R8_9FLAO|nr:PD40 domain-containing protein [Pontimicrobium aquaticum]TJY38011.1 hypothetical protein E5167_01770 [Pontimicrobium aquaticum]